MSKHLDEKVAALYLNKLGVKLTQLSAALLGRHDPHPGQPLAVATAELVARKQQVASACSCAASSSVERCASALDWGTCPPSAVPCPDLRILTPLLADHSKRLDRFHLCRFVAASQKD